MKNLLYYIISLLDDNWGYSTPVQKRYKVGDTTNISSYKLKETEFEVGTKVTIVEYSRYDYLVEDEHGNLQVVYQFELY